MEAPEKSKKERAAYCNCEFRKKICYSLNITEQLQVIENWYENSLMNYLKFYWNKIYKKYIDVSIKADEFW